MKRSWHLLAEGDDGPLIPSMAVEAIIRSMLAGSTPNVGARTAVHGIELDSYENLFAKRTIYTGIRNDSERVTSLYHEILGAAWNELQAQSRLCTTSRGHSQCLAVGASSEAAIS